jgi:transposase
VLNHQRASRLQRAIEREYERPWRDVLAHLLYVRRLTHKQAATELRLPRSTVTTWAIQIEAERAAEPQPEAASV